MLLTSRPKAASMAHLTQEQRYKIEAFKKAGYKNIAIANEIGVDKSTIGRELKRNSDSRNGVYRASLAHKKASKRIEQKPKKISFTKTMESRIIYLLEHKEYSPEQIVGDSQKKGIEMVSHERIYQFIWQNKKQGSFLHSHLRRKGRRYRKRGNLKDNRGIITGRIGIEHRPEIVDKKQRVGDFEIDTIIGKNHQGAIVTINDRKSGFLKMKKVKTRKADEVEKATIELLMPYKPWIKTITADNGKEFANHKAIADALDVEFYFARPYHSWERGANENLNGLIRQYIPKKSDFEQYTDQQVQAIENKLNERPRKRHNYESPKFVLEQDLKNQKVAFVT